MAAVLLLLILFLSVSWGEEAVVVVASIDDGTIPLRLGMDTLHDEARLAVERHRLSRRAVAHCRQGNASCVADLVAREAAVERPSKTSCELRITQPRDNEVLVLGDLEMFVVSRRGSTSAAFVGRLFVDAWSPAPGGALGAPIASWVDVQAGRVSVRLEPPFRRAGGGGSSMFPVRGELRVAVAAPVDCDGPTWLHAGLRVVYRPFAEPDPPRPPLGRGELLATTRHRAKRNCAYATLLYDDRGGYARGAVALFASLRASGAKHAFAALLGAGVGEATRAALRALGVEDLRDVDVKRSSGHGDPEPSSALPALGTGQWLKLQLWDLPYDRVLYLDADALVLRNIDELLETAAIDAPLAAVNDYFAGAVLLVTPNPATAAAFRATLAQDAGRYVYGEQDFLNVHFAGTHALLAGEYHCLAEATAIGLATKQNHSTGDFAAQLVRQCAVLEFSSCSHDGGVSPAWKPWHGRGTLLPERRVCLFPPGPEFHALASLWTEAYARGMATLEALTVSFRTVLAVWN
ncbi:hypothetical protein CTAYLR_009867 [Chrysophaeum taylorii]|uniref:Hexosyltransferase n=1 Tax=Chrysophaeum taylorii TaxID=2483200 RepID=A0AAD7U7K5_9STRA|nr:hypothetical protein CTAYLR_009867 [Chrysophaeum taylorii]